MPFNSIGDLASSLILSQASLQAKKSLMRHSQELTTGITSDVSERLRNDHSIQMGWEHSIATNRILTSSLSESLAKVQAKQTAINAASDTAVSFANTVSVTLASNSSPALDVLANTAKIALEKTLSHLNISVAGQSLFSGARTDLQAMASADDIIASVKNYIGIATSAGDISQRLESWMDELATGFDTIAYTGGSEDPAEIRVTTNQTISETTKGDHPAFRTTLQNLILASLAADDTLAGSSDVKAGLLQSAADGLRASNNQLIKLSANIGHIESELAKGKAYAESQISVAEQLRAEILGVDEFEAASNLQETELQLEKIYTITARSARLSLLEYLR